MKIVYQIFILACSFQINEEIDLKNAKRRNRTVENKAVETRALDASRNGETCAAD